jgi:RimJ/RimL family protein N-acetyltransferase/quercetin dioxygenase-like cupin family protein
MNLTFELLSTSHFPLMLEWLESPHIKKWWDQDISYTLDTVKEKYGDYIKGYKQAQGSYKSIKAYIICTDSQPIGYIQLYNAYDFPRSKRLSGLPENLGAFDIFIGDKNYLGKDIGSQAIKQFFHLYANHYSYIFADPDLNNITAIKAYEKAGFKKVAEQKDTNEIWMLWKNETYGQHEVTSALNALHFIWGENCEGWWLKKNGSFTVISEMMPPGTSEAKHFHTLTEQFFYVLEGKVNIELDKREYSLQEHEGIRVPAGTLHKIRNCSKQNARFLVVSCPDSQEDRINAEDIYSFNSVSRNFTFTDEPNPGFDEKISRELRLACKNLTGITPNLKKIRIYAKQGKRTVAGLMVDIHGTIAWLDSIYVEEAFQNQGLGIELMNKLCDHMQKSLVSEIQLNTYFPKAYHFFKKCGFKDVACIPNWKYGLTCYLMKKLL